MKPIDELRMSPLPTGNELLRQQARGMAYSLGISLFIRDGRIYQRGPGEEIAKPAGSAPGPMPELPGKVA